MHEGEAKLGQARRALEAGEGGGGLALARSGLKEAKEAFVRAKKSEEFKAAVLRLEGDLAIAEEQEKRRHEAIQAAAARVREAEEAYQAAALALGAGGDEEEIAGLLARARAALALLADAPGGFSIEGLQANLDEAEGQLAGVRAARAGGALLLAAREALALEDVDAVARGLEAARAALQGGQEPAARQGLAACEALDGELAAVRGRLAFERRAARDAAAGEAALEEAGAAWRTQRDAERAAGLVGEAAVLFRAARQLGRVEAADALGAAIRAEQEEERQARARAEARAREQRMAADDMVARARMLVGGAMLGDARAALARAREAYALAVPPESAAWAEVTAEWDEVASLLSVAEEERRRTQAAEQAEREKAQRRGHVCLAEARGVLAAGGNDFDAARGYCKEAGECFRRAREPQMEEEVLALIEAISAREDEVCGCVGVWVCGCVGVCV